MNGLEWYNQGRSVMKNITLIIVFIIVVGIAVTALSYFSGNLTLTECLTNLLTPEIGSFLLVTGIVGVILLVVYAFLSEYFRTKPFWGY
jgi:uncharacterized membrane protein